MTPPIFPETIQSIARCVHFISRHSFCRLIMMTIIEMVVMKVIMILMIIFMVLACDNIAPRCEHAYERLSI